ncbi:MAG TPA: carbamoyltransferase HypF [Bryobacteraceae bacterium]
MRKKLDVHGIVQGVGFRPWVYNLARGLGLSGYVLNSSSGVTVEVEGSPEGVRTFLEEFVSHPPALAQIDDLVVSEMEASGDEAFVIRHSLAQVGVAQEGGGREGGEHAFALVPPDIATCAECCADFTDPKNRRYRYPFTNCTNCGPRYSIIRDVPYDRPATTMGEFEMCAACRAEYEDPGNRRFHAQPNACAECGPELVLWDRERVLERGDRALGRVKELLLEGRIVAIKGLGGFHLACDASNDGAVRLLRERKRRSGKPFALMARDVEAAEKFCWLTEAERRALLGPRRPIVIVRRREGTGVSGEVVSLEIAPGNRTVGVMLPYTPLHHLLFEDRDEFLALVMTSGNLSEEPIASRDEEVGPRLHPLCDYFLLHDRKIQTRVDDSIVRVFEGRDRVLRRSRGYAPHPVDLGVALRPILAMGGELKSTFCLTAGHYAILSQHIGDLENLETRTFFEETLGHMKRFFRVEPEVVAYDLHPGYLSTQMALAMRGVELVGVQHHFAHIASCMAENRLAGRAIGVAMDGTGYGTDGKIWGGEVLVCDYSGFERRGHFRYVALAGGDAGVREPWRMGLSYLLDAFGEEAWGLDVPMLREVAERKLRTVAAMIERRVNTVETSSCGRLFDAVSAVLGVRTEITYEGQAAIELENCVEAGVEGAYPFEIVEGVIDFRGMVREMVRDRGTVGEIAGRFHNTVAEAIAESCRRVRKSDGLSRVCLSGGSFQNSTLLERVVGLLRRDGFEVFLHARVPPNDGGISLGQAVVANAVAKGRMRA